MVATRPSEHAELMFVSRLFLDEIDDAWLEDRKPDLIRLRTTDLLVETIVDAPLTALQPAFYPVEESVLVLLMEAPERNRVEANAAERRPNASPVALNATLASGALGSTTVGILTLDADRTSALVFRHGVSVGAQAQPIVCDSHDDGHSGSQHHAHDLP
jgi:hypothetical protein